MSLDGRKAMDHGPTGLAVGLNKSIGEVVVRISAGGGVAREADRLRAEYADAARTIYPAAHEREVDRRASPALHEVRS